MIFFFEKIYTQNFETFWNFEENKNSLNKYSICDTIILKYWNCNWLYYDISKMTWKIDFTQKMKTSFLFKTPKVVLF